MRILVVSAYFAPHVGGVEKFAEVLAGGLSGRGHDVTVLCCRTDRESKREERTSAGFRVVRVPALNPTERRLGTPLPIPSPFELHRTLARLLPGTDAVHVNDALYPTTWAAVSMAARRGIPTLMTQHVGFVRQRNAFLDGVERLAVRAVGPIARRTTRVVSYNAEVAAWAHRTWRIPRVDLLPAGVSIAGEPADRAALGLPEGFVALFVGRDVPKKGLAHVLAAADPGYHLVAVTDARIPSGDHVEIRGFMPHDDLLRLLRAVDALVLPSVDEGIPLVIQEAALVGLPIVTTDQPGLRTYFDRDDLVLVEPRGDSVRTGLLQLAGDPALRVALAERVARAGRRHFTDEAFIEAYERALSSLAMRAGDEDAADAAG